MNRIKRIPTLEITSAAESRIQTLCERLDIADPRDLIDRALKALELLADVAGKSTTLTVSNPTTGDTREVRIR